MRHARQTIELDVVFLGALAQLALGLAAQVSHLPERCRKPLDCGPRQAQQFADDGVTLGICAWCAAFFHFAKSVLQSLDQQLAALRVVQQVVLQIGVALHHPDIAQHLVKHAGGTTRLTLVTQPVQQIPGACTQQANHDFSVRKGGVVVRNFTNAGLLSGNARPGITNIAGDGVKFI